MLAALSHASAYLFILAVIIFIHEMGHYLACKFQGIEVGTFSLGFGPVLGSLTLWNTLFTVRLFPLGGFIKPRGIEGRPDDVTSSVKGNYYSKKWYNRLAVVYAGPLMNFVLAFFLFAGLLWIKGSPSYSTQPVIGEVQPDSLAEKAGLKVGDRILAMSESKDTSSQLASDWRSIHNFLFTHSNVVLFVERNGQKYIMQISRSNNDPGQLLGISPQVVLVSQSLSTAATESSRICTFQVSEMIRLIVSKVSGKSQVALMGPIGIYGAVAQASSSWTEIFSITALLSLSLGFFNLLPIPLLDGGSAMLFWLEGLTGYYPPVFILNLLQLVGLVVIGAIFLFAATGDILRILHL